MTEDEKRRRLALMLRERHEALRVQIERLRAEADVIERASRELEGLQDGEAVSSVTTGMVDAHKTAISAARRGERDAEFGETINAAGYSVRSLAAALAVSPAALHAHRAARGEKNSRPIPAARAAHIQQLTGWPADEAHWPCGIASKSDQ